VAITGLVLAPLGREGWSSRKTNKRNWKRPSSRERMMAFSLCAELAC